jgi:hypothetical protein
MISLFYCLNSNLQYMIANHEQSGRVSCVHCIIYSVKPVHISVQKCIYMFMCTRTYVWVYIRVCMYVEYNDYLDPIRFL